MSAHSGLPALTVPAGFTDDGLPVGMDLLGRDFSDAELLSIGFALEQTLKLRRTPFSTPALENDKAPAPRRFVTTIGEFAYDIPTATLTFKANLERLKDGRVTAVWIHRGDEQKPGATIHQLFAGSGAALPVAVILSNVDREALREGKLVGRVYSGQSIGAVQNIKLVLPAQ